MTAQTWFYALKPKKQAKPSSVTFICRSYTEENFRVKVRQAFFSRHGTLPKGVVHTLMDFLNDYDQVIVSIEPVSIINGPSTTKSAGELA